MKLVPFASLFQFIRNGLSVKQDKLLSGLPITRIETIAQGEVDSVRVGYAGLDEEDCAKWLLEPGDILFSHINSPDQVGKCAVYTGIPDKLVHGMNLLALRPDQSVVVPQFAKYLIRSRGFRKKLSRYINRAVNQASVSVGNLGTIGVALPPLDEQRRIADILDRADDLRAKRRRAIEQLEALKQSIFLHMFGDPVRNEREWDVVPFGSVCESRLGKMVDQKQETGRYARPYLRNANVQWFSFDLTTVYEMDFYPEEREKFRLKPGDLIICEGGQPGRAAVWTGEIEECYYQKALHRAEVLKDRAVPEYLVLLLWFFVHHGGLKDHVTSATISHLTGVKLKSMHIPLPPLSVQKELARRLDEVEKMRTTASVSLVELDALFSSLQHRAFARAL